MRRLSPPAVLGGGGLVVAPVFTIVEVDEVVLVDDVGV